jgi:nucleotide-binding universal stress UspA family protein
MIHQTNPIIAGIDFSAASNFVLRHAIHAAQFSGIPVLAVHVLDSGRLSHWAASAGAGLGPETIIKQAEAKLKALVQAEAGNAEVLMEVRTGKAADELQKVVEEQAAWMLVIAANDMTKSRLGSVASRCVRSASCDVLVLRDWQEGDFSKIVICTDFSETSKRALARGIALASANHSSLEIVHVMYPPDMDPWGETLDHAMDSPTTYAEECQTRIQRRMQDFLAPHRADLAQLPHSALILQSRCASAAITSHIRQNGADLVVLGVHGVSRITGFLLGSNAENLLQEATVSILAVRD